MLKSRGEKLFCLPGLCAGLLMVLLCFPGPGTAVSQTTRQSQPDPVKDGIGVGEISIGISTASAVEARYGMKYELRNNNDYSYRMEYSDSGMAFYYCFKDARKRIFLVEVHHGVTSKGITVGQSTLKDVLALYGERSGGDEQIYEYKGIQFYFEADRTPGADEASKLDRKVVEVDIVAPEKSSNFCD